MTTKTVVGRLEHAEVDVVEPLVDVDQRVVVRAICELLGDERQVLGADQLGGLRATAARAAGRCPNSCLTMTCLMRSPSIDGARHDVDDALAIEPEVEEDAVVAELEVAVDEADLPPELAVERDGGVDRDGRRPDAALGAVEREDPAERRARQERRRAARSGPAGS